MASNDNAASRARIPAGRKAVYALCVLLVVLLLAEGALRVLGIGEARPVADYIADWDAQWGGDFYTLKPDPGRQINTDGLRDRQRRVNKPADVLRIVCLGDSVTFGYGVARAESYPAVLEGLLTDAGHRVEVLNVALPGWSTRQQRIAYEQIARRYKPDMVLLGFCLNDVAEMGNNLARPPAVLVAAYRYSHLVRVLLMPHAWELHRVEELFEQPVPRAAEQGWALCHEELRSLRDLVEGDGAVLGLVVFPFRFQLDAGAPPPTPQEQLARFCAAEEIVIFDALPVLKNVDVPAFIDEDHLSFDGAQAVARALARWQPLSSRVAGAASSAD